MGKSLDDHIKKALMEGTQSASDVKEDVLENIQNSINSEKGVSLMTKKRKAPRTPFMMIASIVGVFILIFFTNTQYGQATIDKVKILFAPNKNITEQIEGMEEEKEYTLQEGQMSYVIYIDESMYLKETQGDKDRIVPINKAEYLPEMFMEISQLKNTSPQEAASQIEDTLMKEYPEYKNQGKVHQPIDALHLTASTGNEFDDLLVKYYLVDNTAGGTFVIKLQYIREAAEGHGGRFWHMLAEFKVVDRE